MKAYFFRMTKVSNDEINLIGIKHNLLREIKK